MYDQVTTAAPATDYIIVAAATKCYVLGATFRSHPYVYLELNNAINLFKMLNVRPEALTDGP